MLISSGNLPNDVLKDEVIIVTGAGRGIGLEAARSLLWLGSKVVIAEIDETTGKLAAETLAKEFGRDRVLFIKTDVGNEEDARNLSKEAISKWGKVDVVLNNATIFPMGAVMDVPIESWDRSYRVNLRGPVLLAREFLPKMVERKRGVFVCVSSSGAAPYMGAYEVFKTSQVELSNTISAEVEGTGVYAFSIGPGIVPTPGFLDGGAKVASFMGMTTDQLLKMNEAVSLSPEAAGVGFAASIALARNYHGKEIVSLQVLKDIGIGLSMEKEKTANEIDFKKAMEAHQKVLRTYSEQSEGWKKRNLFERQWVFRDFKKQTGMSVDEMLSILSGMEEDLKDHSSVDTNALAKLKTYYEHQEDLLRSFEKDAEKMDESLKVIESWIADIEGLQSALGAG